MEISAASLQTICSSPRQSFQTFNIPKSPAYRKKRIGSYYYYLEDCIGNGYSSKVFKAFSELQPGSIFAIKVIRLDGLDKTKK